MASTATNDGAAVFQPRSYQLEMLEESKQRNIIVAVRFHSRLLRYDTKSNRWIQAPERRTCEDLLHLDIKLPNNS